MPLTDLLAKARAETCPSLSVNFEASAIGFDYFLYRRLTWRITRSEMLAFPVPLFGDERVNPKSQVITMACQSNRRESVDKAVDENERKGYDDDVKMLY
jgi:hypothetical protein